MQSTTKRLSHVEAAGQDSALVLKCNYFMPQTFNGDIHYNDQLFNSKGFIAELKSLPVTWRDPKKINYLVRDGLFYKLTMNATTLTETLVTDDGIIKSLKEELIKKQ